MPEELTGWAELRALLTEATALVDEIEPLAQAGTLRAWQVQQRVVAMAVRLEKAAAHCRAASLTGYTAVRDPRGKVVRLEWKG